MIMLSTLLYHNDRKVLDRHVWANNVDPDQTALLDQGLNSVCYSVHLLDRFLNGKNMLSTFKGK